MRYSIGTSSLLGTLLLLAADTNSFASGKIGYGSRAGMTVSVVSMSGLDTTSAIIRTKHTQDDAVAFCREYVGKVTQMCIREELEVPLNDFISANCLTGEFTDFSGNRYRFLGPNKANNDDGISAKYLVKDLSSGEIADGSSASGYPVNMGIFKALCPRTTPFDPY